MQVCAMWVLNSLQFLCILFLNQSKLIHGADCCKECQVKDWKDHKADCKKFQNEEYKKDKKFIRNFFTKRQNLITEKVKAASVETGLETTELFIDIDFSCSGHDIAPALQDIPKIQIATNLKDFLNEGQKVSERSSLEYHRICSFQYQP